ncbi:MAG: helix-turn-helix domain-containing protein [FCB group bacterium]|nr:helix-turn-helix domain-containing protein [FCB group bacterium]
MRVEFKFDPPVEIQSPLGALKEIYDGIDLTAHMVAEQTFSGINENGILHVTEVMKAGEVFSIEVRKGHRLDKIVIDLVHTLQIMAAHNCLQYWFTIGKDGVFEITGQLIRDDDGFLGKLRTDLRDTNMRSYLVKRSLADSEKLSIDEVEFPGIMAADEAAQYLRISKSTLYKKTEIPRTKNKKFRKVDLNNYLKSR